MAHLDAYLDACAAYGWSGGPEFKTRIVTMANGREQRNADWKNGRHRYTLPFVNIERDRYRAIRQMFEVCRGMAHCFRYVDPLDSVASDEVFGVGDGSRTVWQLSKSSVIDGVTYTREVRAIPTDGEFSLSIDGTVAGGSTYGLDRERGLVAFSAAPANGSVLTWSAPQFDVWVRFDADWLPFSIDDIDAHNGSFDLLEVPPPAP